MTTHFSPALRAEVQRRLITQPKAPSAAGQGTKGTYGSTTCLVYGAVQSPSDEREASLHHVAVLGYN